MPLKDTEYTVHFWVENLSSTDGHYKGTGVTGQNTTTLAGLQILQDGNISAATVNSTTLAELDTTDAPGWYSLLISSTQNDGTFMGLVGESTTSNVAVHAKEWENDDDAEAIYYADIKFKEAANSPSGDDEYTCFWYKYGTVQTSQPTSPTIYVYDRDGNDLITTTAMSEIGSTGVFTFTADGTAGQLQATTDETIIVKVTASIESSTRTWQRVLMVP